MESNVFEKLIIFEMANNHQGSVEHGINIINAVGELASKYGINAAIKFQYRDLDTMIHPDYKNRTDVKHIPRFMSTRLNSDQFYQLVKVAKSVGLKTMCTPFDEKSVDLICEHGIDIIKIASCSAVDWPLLEKVAQANKPVIISTGGKSFLQMDRIYSFLEHRGVNFAMLHCVGMYPVKEEDVQLNVMTRMMNRYHVPVGYSGHENPNDFTICKMAIAKGASILERHVGLATNEIKLNAYSTDVRDADKWIEAIISAFKICGGDEDKRIPEAELKSMEELARGAYVNKAIKQGDKINREDVFFAMPCQTNQTTSGEFVEGMVATRDYSKNEPLYERRADDIVYSVRDIIHDVKGMLAEANIVVGPDFELELSHHYGLDKFREYGATIVNIINREYCKKLIIMLPGQKHPNHYHKVKEESFQVLYGKLDLIMDGKYQEVRTGEVVTVKRNSQHAFSSKDGCIFEEISTTHVKNDSYYEDERIAKLDLMQRKTILENW
ncbi:MAG: N-acetylneuraminate synthase family protein [Clostridia bacterium]|nr:N-acetylneuraminate synthase family protein [Clostridia bacterium]